MGIILGAIDLSGVEVNKTISVISTILIGIGVMIFKSTFVQDIFSGFFTKVGDSLFGRIFTKSGKKTDVKSINESDILNHDVFNYIDFWLYNQIPTMTLRTQYRTVVFRKYLHVYFKEYKSLLLEFTKNGEYKDMESSELRRNLLKLITDVTKRMEYEMRSIGIPDVVIIKMKNKLVDKINLKMDLINSIFDSTFYDSEENYLKVYSFLNIVHSILDNTISNIEPVCDNINGELSGLTMDGFIEPISKKGKH